MLSVFTDVLALNLEENATMKDLENEISYEQNKTPSRYTLYRRDPDKEFDYYEGTERLADFLKIQDIYRVRRDNFHTQTSMQFFSSYMNDDRKE